MLPPGLGEALLDFWDYFLHLAVALVPLFIGASFLVGLTQEYLLPEKVERKLHGHDEGTANVAAAGLGAVTPFCSCSTVPVLAGLLQAGAPLGLPFSFLLASPLINEIAVLLLIGLFGIEITVYYVVMTSLAAVIGGIVIGRLGLVEHVKTSRSSRKRSRPLQRTAEQLIIVQAVPSRRARRIDSTLRRPHARRGHSSSIRLRTSFSE